MIRSGNRYTLWLLSLSAAVLMTASPVMAQTGVDDDRVSLPEGPGSLEGLGDNVEIDPNMGAMSTNVPIAVPAGFGSLTPDLTLSYSSSSSSGPVGIGWSMSLKSIERMTARRVPLYDTDDFIAADGSNELVQIETEGDGDLVYRARFEKDFTRYTWVEPGSGADGYWIAQFADGTTGYFGADKNGNLVDSARATHPTDGTFKYMLVDHVDQYGHTLSYAYQSDFGDGLNNRPLLVGVSWVDDGAGSTLYSAELTWEGRNDYLSDAGAGYEELLTQRLTGVVVRNGGETVREYVLSYEDESTSGGFSRLEKVEQYGLGGVAGGELYPAIFQFGYQKGLGVQCDTMGPDDDCGGDPYVFDMGNVAGGGNLTSGKATLIDINGDGLADILDTADVSGHQFYLNTLTPNDSGSFDHGFGDAVASAVDTSLVLTNASDTVQVLDFNGDGFSDLIDTNSGTVLLNDPDGDDWLSSTGSANVDAIRSLDFTATKFFDYDNDKKIDVLLATASGTQVFVNSGVDFTAITTQDIERTTAAPTVHMADFNGDGLNDVVEILEGGAMQYRLNLGRGNWGEWTGINDQPGDPVLDITSTELSQLDLEDLNGDGLSDLVITGQGQIKYAINRSARRFDDWVVLDGDEVSGTIPDRTNKLVLYADMNANGSEDIVWFDASGNVTYLELFPTRPNLLSRVENGLGFVQKITYGTSAEHAARAEAEGDPWDTALPHPNAVVDEVDIFVTLTGSEDGSGLHEITTYSYRNGWYDGIEKQFRGFSDVTVTQLPGEGQEGGQTISRFHLGNEGKAHFNGLLLEQATYSGARLLNRAISEYSECELADVPAPADLVNIGKKAVYHPCQTASQTEIVEGLTDESQWVTTRSEMQYDGWGQVSLASELGNVDDSTDQDYTRTSYYEPTPEFWMLGLVAREEHSASPEFPAADTNLTLNYYDGEDFEGLPEGQATHGFLTRSETAIAPGEFIQTLRQRRDEHGNSVETIDPNGTLESADHRRSYTYDDTGLFLTSTDLHVSADHDLRRDTVYETNFGNLVEATKWMLVEDGEVKTARRSTSYRYDAFGRIVESFQPGDDDDKPTTSWIYEMDAANPFIRVVAQQRSVQNGAVDLERFDCFDSRGRKYQSRAQMPDNGYLVTGFTVFNSRGTEIEVFQPYASDTAECEETRPNDVPSTQTTYDSTQRLLTVSAPGESIYGERLVSETRYLPLASEAWDPEDLDESSPHANTPTRTINDGLGRPVALERVLADGSIGRTELLYDGTNSFAGYVDADGNRHEQTVDLADRVTSITDPNVGTRSITYDAASNVTALTDARGVTVTNVYDGQNRLLERYEEGNREATLETWHYDTLPSACELTECTNLSGQLAMVTYPLQVAEGTTLQGADRFGYDTRNQQVFTGRRYGEVLDLVSTTTYDNIGRAVTVSYPDGTDLSQVFDDGGRLVSIPGFVDTIEYDAQGLRKSVRYFNGTRTDETRDALLRLASWATTDAAGNVIEGGELTRDRIGNITKIDDLATVADVPGSAATYGYDAWYRVTSASLINADMGAEDLSWTFDLVDRITALDSTVSSSALALGALSYSDTQPLAVTEAGGTTYAYDAAGQMTRREDVTLTYDHLGRIAMMASNDAQVRDLYGDGQARVGRVEADGLVLYGPSNFEVRDGIATTWVRLDLERLARHETSALATSLYSDGNGDGGIDAGDAYLVGESTELVDRRRTLGAAAARLLLDQEDATTFFHSDHLGNVVAATDEGGAVRGQRGYYLHGGVRFETGDVGPYGFTGQDHDAFSGLIRFEHRALDPVTGRWNRFDPAFVEVSAASLNRFGEATTGFAYVANNPANNVDPTGLRFEKTKAAFKKLGNKISGVAGRAKQSAKESLTRNLNKLRNKLQSSEQRQRTGDVGISAPSSNPNLTDGKRAQFLTNSNIGSFGDSFRQAGASNQLDTYSTDLQKKETAGLAKARKKFAPVLDDIKGLNGPGNGPVGERDRVLSEAPVPLMIEGGVPGIVLGKNQVEQRRSTISLPSPPRPEPSFQDQTQRLQQNITNGRNPLD